MSFASWEKSEPDRPTPPSGSGATLTQADFMAALWNLEQGNTLNDGRGLYVAIYPVQWADAVATGKRTGETPQEVIARWLVP